MPPSKKRRARNVVLGYVRQSFTANEDDKASPERQRKLAEELVRSEGWEVEWYEDADGHKSGRFVENRPGWLALEKRLADPDVVAVVAYDLARLHRKGHRIGDLLDKIEKYDVDLIFTRPGYEIDTTTRGGKFMAQIRAMLDEDYAEEVSERTKAAISVLRAEGKTVGPTPFGTVRDAEGFLMPSPEGAWFLPDGRFVNGDPDESPEPGAVWRSYYDCAVYTLTIYVEDNKGMEKIAYQLNAEGWPFRDRKGDPRPATRDDVRRVLANWPEYGGLVPEKRAKDRTAYDDDVDPARMIPERAVMPLDLLNRVAEIRSGRSRKPSDDGVKREARAYPLSKLVYCAHCEQLAEEQQDPRLRVRLTGLVDPRGKRRYKHKPGVKCGCTNRTVPADDLEREFGRLLKLLTIREESLDYLTALSVETLHGAMGNDDEIDLEQQREEAIALCQRRIDAAIHLYGDGRISREEYLRRVDQNEREIAHWQARTTETERKALELSMCIEAVNRMSRTWDTADDEDKQGMAQHLFSEVVFNLDTRRIVSFKLKPWADDFLMVRMEAYYDEFGDLDEGDEDDEGYASALEKANSNTLLGCWNPLPHRGLYTTSFPKVRFAQMFALAIAYYEQALPSKPVSNGTPTKCARNEEIRARHASGEPVGYIARLFDISEQRVSQIVRGRRK